MNDQSDPPRRQNRTNIGISPRNKDDPFCDLEYDFGSHPKRFFDVDVDVDVEAEHDDHDETVHDQLPSVEDAKMYNATANRRTRRRRGRVFTKMALVCGVAIACVSYGMHARTKNQHRKAVASLTETVRLSHPDAFRDSGSPQSRALRWMLHDDGLRLPLPSNRTDPFVQRYIIAVLLFALTDSTTKPFMPQNDLRGAYDLLSGSHECEWNMVDAEGVTTGFLCGNDDGSITDIVLPGADLDGELPREVEALNHLESVDMSGNLIHGKLPAMPYLTNLDLAYNRLTGYLPDHFSEMTRLNILSLSENALQGSIPNKFAALTDLKILALNGNQLTGGLEKIYSLSKLEELYLFSNSFENQLSNGSFGKLLNLKVIDVKNNLLSGPLPDALFSTLTNLEVIDFHQNALNGHINDVVAKGHSLRYMDVSSNLLSGGLPSSINNLRALTHLDLSYNRFEKSLPSYLKDMTQMQTLLLTEDDGLGPQTIPEWLRGMTDLTQLSFRLTSRKGTIPTWFGELTRLELLDLDWNHISGTIPTELGNLTNLKYLMLNRNRMTGTIPTEVSRLPNLKMLLVDTNEFTGGLLTGDEETLDGGGVVCAAQEPDRRIPNMVADCGNGDDGTIENGQKEVDCPCCTGCCWDGSLRCNMKDWIIELEDEYRSGYRQDR